ncbi:MAG: hypothetical protein LBI18_06170 [Planctomycetaceae bacterium]|nr:hypothetical protein [Planctomycetaceae bacterium]
MAFGLGGCSHKKTNRGHLFRCDWAFEYNRTPWVGCPPNSGCDDENNCNIEGCEKCSSRKKGLFDCFKKGNDHDCSCEGHKPNKGFRRHCGLSPECTAKNPCCRTLGCGMWIDPADPNSFAGLGNGAKACGLTPFCSPMKPCGLTPNCGRANPNYMNQQIMNQQMLMLGNNGMVLPNTTTMPSAIVPNSPTVPTPIPPKKTIETPPMQPTNPKTPVLAGPNGLLISMGVVPGVSTITTGGVVAAAGVTTPVGIMTPAGVRLPNGMVNSNAVIKACAMHSGCTAARPCGLTPGCGMMVPVAMVSNNAVQLASALQSPGVAGGIMQAGGMAIGMANNRFAYPNPMPNQPIHGMTMSGFAQTGYPAIGYAPTGYSRPNRIAAEANLFETENNPEEEEPPLEETEAEIKSPMPVPRFHPVPTKPVFQRSEGLPVSPRTGNNKATKTTTSAKTISKTTIDQSRTDPDHSKRFFSVEALNEAMEQAYLEGMSAAMEEVEEELDMRSDELTTQSEELDKREMQEKILEQAQKLQKKIEKQKELELQVHQEALRKEARRIAAQTAAEEQEIREQEIREEAAREMAIRERVIREEAAREIAAQEQALQVQLEQQNQLLESAGIQQALLSQSQTIPIPQTYSARPTPQTVQPVNYNMNTNMNATMSTNINSPVRGKDIMASAVDFLRGKGQRMNPQPLENRMRQPTINQPMFFDQPIITSNAVTPQNTGYALQPTRQRLPQPVAFNNRPIGMANNVPNGMTNNVPDMVPMSGLGLLQSAKSTGTNLLSTVTGVLSPFSGLLGSETPNIRQQGQNVPRPMAVARSAVPVGQQVSVVSPLPVRQPVPRSGAAAQQSVPNIGQMGMSLRNGATIPTASPTSPPKIPIPQLSGNSSSRSCPDCLETLPEHNYSIPHTTASITMNKRIPASVASKISEEESDMFIPELPQKPPTKSKTVTKPRKSIEVDDDEETSMIRQANFVDR